MALFSTSYFLSPHSSLSLPTPLSFLSFMLANSPMANWLILLCLLYDYIWIIIAYVTRKTFVCWNGERGQNQNLSAVFPPRRQAVGRVKVQVRKEVQPEKRTQCAQEPWQELCQQCPLSFLKCQSLAKPNATVCMYAHITHKHVGNKKQSVCLNSGDKRLPFCSAPVPLFLSEQLEKDLCGRF